MNKCLLALAMVSLNSYSATATMGWSGVVPSIAQVPANITVEKETIHFDLYGKHVELSVTNLTKDQIIIDQANVPMLALDL
ncbi:hypothetical protein [Vibrio jasicida]|uniref:hypothetical protein n=1 Tax=Vibrio jasicida TaxID=766224 RepID=UPI000576A998|nr:hypothetical protein [Vibrio jasicida]